MSDLGYWNSSFFQTVEIKEPTDKETIKILENFCNEIEFKQGVTITYQAIEAAVKLSKQYIRDRVLPEKAIDILDETATSVRRNIPTPLARMFALLK